MYIWLEALIQDRWLHFMQNHRALPLVATSVKFRYHSRFVPVCIFCHNTWVPLVKLPLSVWFRPMNLCGFWTSFLKVLKCWDILATCSLQFRIPELKLVPTLWTAWLSYTCIPCCTVGVHVYNVHVSRNFGRKIFFQIVSDRHLGRFNFSNYPMGVANLYRVQKAYHCSQIAIGTLSRVKSSLDMA